MKIAAKNAKDREEKEKTLVSWWHGIFRMSPMYQGKFCGL